MRMFCEPVSPRLMLLDGWHVHGEQCHDPRDEPSLACASRVPCANPNVQSAGPTECRWDPGLADRRPKPGMETASCVELSVVITAAPVSWSLLDAIAMTRRELSTRRTRHDVALQSWMVPKNFTGGTVQFDHFQTGGTPVKNDYNFYSLQVSDPQATYTFNRNEEKVGHYAFPIDYRVTIPIRGGAIVTMGAYDSNDVAIANHKHFMVVGVPPAPQPFDGQFFQIDVESVAVRAIAADQ